MTNDRPRSPGDVKWIIVVVAASTLTGFLFDWWANAQIQYGSGPVEALDSPLSGIPEQAVTE